jgi:hypothetical protein
MIFLRHRFTDETGTDIVSTREMSRGCIEAQYKTANAALDTLSQR